MRVRLDEAGEEGRVAEVDRLGRARPPELHLREVPTVATTPSTTRTASATAGLWRHRAHASCDENPVVP